MTTKKHNCMTYYIQQTPSHAFCIYLVKPPWISCQNKTHTTLAKTECVCLCLFHSPIIIISLLFRHARSAVLPCPSLVCVCVPWTFSLSLIITYYYISLMWISYIFLVTRDTLSFPLFFFGAGEGIICGAVHSFLRSLPPPPPPIMYNGGIYSVDWYGRGCCCFIRNRISCVVRRYSIGTVISHS